FHLAWSPDSRLLASSSADGSLRIWDPNTWRAIGNIETGASITSMAWSRDTQSIAIGSRDGYVTTWNIETKRQIRRLEGTTGAVRSLSYSFDNSILAFRSQSFTTAVYLWRTDTWEQLGIIPVSA